MSINMNSPIRVIVLSILLLPALLFSQEESRLLQLEIPRMNRKDVQELQQFLLYQRYWLGEDGVDGWFGPDTDGALRAYQRDKGLAVTVSIRIPSLTKERSLSFSIRPYTDPPPQKQPLPLTFSYGRRAQPMKPPLFDSNSQQCFEPISAIFVMVPWRPEAPYL
jgi:peptidoglycan hydrolase-like protein with peptidoglycan-binding domain